MLFESQNCVKRRSPAPYTLRVLLSRDACIVSRTREKFRTGINSRNCRSKEWKCGVFHSIRRRLAGTLGRSGEDLMWTSFRDLEKLETQGNEPFARKGTGRLGMREFMMVQKSCKSSEGSIGTGSCSNEKGLRVNEVLGDIAGGSEMRKSIWEIGEDTPRNGIRQIRR